jgi:hypothetical protein
METNESGNENDRELDVFQLKVYYWIMVLLFSAVFIYFSGIDFHETNLHNKRVETLLFALVMGILLIYLNLFYEDYALGKRLYSSLFYLICLCAIAYIYKPLLYDASSFQGVRGHVSTDMLIIAPVALIILYFAFYIVMDGFEEQ